MNPLIPQSVENVILKSMRKNPDERYQSADEMLADLETCLLPERRNEPKAEFYVEEDVDRPELSRQSSRISRACPNGTVEDGIHCRK